MSQQVENVRTLCPRCGAINDVVVVLPGRVVENDMVACRECDADMGRRHDIRDKAKKQAESAGEPGTGPSISVKPDIVQD